MIVVSSTLICIDTELAVKPWIGFRLYAINANLEEISSPKGDHHSYFLLLDDFSTLIPIFQRIFPITNPYNQEVQTHFEVCWENVFDLQDSQKLIKYLILEQGKADSTLPSQYIEKLIQVLKHMTNYADYIVLEGNL